MTIGCRKKKNSRVHRRHQAATRLKIPVSTERLVAVYVDRGVSQLRLSFQPKRMSSQTQLSAHQAHWIQPVFSQTFGKGKEEM